MVLQIPIIYPMPRTRKGYIIITSILIGLFLIGAFFVYFFWAQDQKKLEEKGQPSFNTLSADELENGLIVTGKIDLAFDTFAEAYETDWGIRTSDNSENLYYVVPIYDVDQDGYIMVDYIIAFEADPKHFETMDKIIEQTWVETPETTELNIENAVIRTLKDDLKQYLDEWAEAPEFYENGSFIDWCAELNLFGTTDKDVIKSKMVPYTIYETATAGSDFSPFWFCIGAAVLAFIILLVLIYRKKPIKGVEETNPLVYDDHFSQARNMDDNSLK